MMRSPEVATGYGSATNVLDGMACSMVLANVTHQPRRLDLNRTQPTRRTWRSAA
jgi:hypothetical protein